MRIVKLTAESKKGLLEDLLQRSPNHYGQYESAVAEIIETVKKGGDEALFSYTEKFDHCKMDAAHIRVTREEIDEAYQKVDADFVEVMKKSAANIRAFHENQLRNSWFDPKPDPRHEDSAHRDCRRLCARWKGCVSLQRTDERASGKGCGRGAYHHDNPSRSRRKGQSWYIGCCTYRRCG